MRNLFILPIEPIENRYPADWYRYVPNQFRDYIAENGLDFVVHQIDGIFSASNSGNTNFLNFVDSHGYKTSQMFAVSELIQKGEVHDGDVFLLTDGWNPCVNNLKTMLEMSNIDARIVGVFHAGGWDSADIIPNTVKNKDWLYESELGMFSAYDDIIVATKFHADLIIEYSNIEVYPITVCPFPMEYMKDTLKKYVIPDSKKRDIVVFPHRNSPEKQPDLADEIGKRLKLLGITYINCRDYNFTKDEYYQLLAQSKVCFSVSLQETLGIAQFEAALLGAMPLVPNRLSYTEMYHDAFKYVNDNDIVQRIVDMLEFPKHKQDAYIHNVDYVGNNFFDGNNGFYQTVLGEQR